MMRKLTFLNCTIAAAMLLLIGCETDRREADINADIAASEAMSEQAAEAWEAGDLKTFAGFFTNDAIWMPPGAAPLQGRDAWWASLESGWNEATPLEVSVTSEEIVVIGDWAFERHLVSEVVIEEPGGEQTQYYDKAIWILRRQEDGAWKIARYIWNENVPPN